MTDVYDVYNTVVYLMCSHCNKTIFKKCTALPESERCATKIHCMKLILKRDDEEYPVKLPHVQGKV